ncbi:DUF4287 domain-containing protein [Paucibacter sp. KBW04]|uniref:DUF4287 domain-containing protein n=1 Tax=Paucibacter sp. KBW04 TaxID=2153361 RepID=UPI000F58411D|nr:DUF4287 domain-containing protein [Paucibacter sp. KBW04]RQO55401.1 DUF4287 domain-containing protein [Paucibacter sp. KBW04]
MSFQAYLDTIQSKTGKSPADFKALAKAKGWMKGPSLSAEIKATQVVDWIKQDFALGHGHAMAIYALLKGLKKEGQA